MVAATALAWPGSARATVEAPAAGYGFAGGSFERTESAADLNRELDAVGATGARWLRVEINWNVIEKTKGTFDWSQPDTLIGAARAHGLTVLANFLGTPGWAGGGALTTAPPTDLGNVTPFVHAFIARYTSTTHFEIWNEPNLPLFFGGSVNAAKYTSLLKRFYIDIKAAAPSATVVSAGLSPGADAAGFYTAMYANGAKGFFDAAAMHPYVFPKGISATPNGWTETGDVRKVMVTDGDADKDIWLTEMGAPTFQGSSGPGSTGLSSGSTLLDTGSLLLGNSSKDMVSQQEQAAQVVSVLSAARAAGYCGPAFIYMPRDTGTSLTDREQNFGALLTHDWKPKYAASVLAR